MLTLENINYKIGDKDIVRDINFSFKKGKVYILTGPNGGGKTSLGKIISGLYPTDSGKILFNNKDISKLGISERSKLGISYGFQSPVYFKGLSVRDILSLASKKHDEIYLNNLLSKVGLCAKEYLDRELNQNLSGGEIKRIEIASVLARENTKIYIFDEPEAGIDLWSFKELINIFEELRNRKIIIIIISHQQKILELSDYIIVMNKSKIVKYGSKEEILPTLIEKEKENNCKGCLKKELL